MQPKTYHEILVIVEEPYLIIELHTGEEGGLR